VRLFPVRSAAFCLAFLLPVLAFALPKMPTGSFEIYSPDEAGGGWIIHRIPGKGDQLWGCKDILEASTCKLVAMGAWNTGAAINFLHVSNDSMAAWLKVTPPLQGDTLMACYSPEEKPKCKRVKVELNPPLANYEREWPSYGGGGAAPASGGGMMGAIGGGAPAMGPEQLLEDPSKAEMWMSAGVKVTGPVNLYACRKLAEGEPECELSIPGWLIIDREDIGFKKVEVLGGKKGVAIQVVEVVEGSVAHAAGIGPGTIITRVGGFRIKNESHFKGLMSQYPATFSFKLTIKDGDPIRLKAKRKPRGGKKKK